MDSVSTLHTYPKRRRSGLLRCCSLLLAVLLAGCASQYALPPKADQAREYYENGLSLYSRQQYSDAIDQYLLALEINPDWAEAHFALGMTYNHTRFHHGAIRSFNEAARLKPNNEDAWYNIGRTHVEFLRDTTAAILECESALVRGQAFPKVTLLLGTLYEAVGWTDNAQQAYADATQLDDRLADAWEHKGLLHYRLEEFDEALEAFEKVVAISPSAAVARFNLGVIRYNRGEFEQAAMEYRKLLAFVPDHIEAHSNLAQAYYTTDRLSEAVEHFKKALQQDSSRVDILVSMAIVYEEMQQPDNAMTAYEQALVLLPTNTTALLNVGILYRNVGRLEDAHRALSGYLHNAAETTLFRRIELAVKELERLLATPED
jgi:tetratricopeptide (TPR) repeat protein